MKMTESLESSQKKFCEKLDRLDLELLLAQAIGKTREFVLAHPEYGLSPAEIRRFARLAKRRIAHEPLAYILGHKEFYGLDFAVDHSTLIPRPETELLVEEALKTIREENAGTVIDVGTGSGCIIVSVAHALRDETEARKFIATDISRSALRIAKRNARCNGIGKKISFLESDLLSCFIDDHNDIGNATVIANLPYLSKEIFSAAAPDVKDYEPKTALLSNRSGLEHYERLFRQIRKLNRKERIIACVLIEFSPEQKKLLAKKIRSILPEARLSFLKDLAGKWRIARIDIR